MKGTIDKFFEESYKQILLQVPGLLTTLGISEFYGDSLAPEQRVSYDVYDRQM